MEQVFSYIIGLGAAVMMPIIFTVLGVCIGIKFSKALKSGLYVGVGFVGLSVITALLTSSLGPALSDVVRIYGLELKVFDMGWPAAASVAYNTLVGSFIIPVCLGVNLVLLLLGCTRTVNIDLWNYWHFAFIGAVVYFMTQSVAWGFFAAIVCYVITLVLADITAKRFQKFYPGMEGISIPQPFCQGFMPFAVAINKALDYVPGINKVNIDSEGMKKKFGLFGEPLVLGVIIGIINERLQEPDCANGFILDGVPRTIAQAEAMERSGISFDAVVAIEVSDDTIVARMGGRRVCESCGASYHIVNVPPKKEGVCDVCGGKLVQRRDDNPETVRDRLAVYHKETEPLKGFYEARGILKTVEDQSTVAGTTQAILAALGR